MTATDEWIESAHLESEAKARAWQTAHPRSPYYVDYSRQRGWQVISLASGFPVASTGWHEPAYRWACRIARLPDLERDTEAALQQARHAIHAAVRRPMGVVPDEATEALRMIDEALTNGMGD